MWREREEMEDNKTYGEGVSEARVSSRVTPWWAAPATKQKPPECPELVGDYLEATAPAPEAEPPADQFEHWETRRHPKAGRVVTFDPRFHDGSLIWPD